MSSVYTIVLTTLQLFLALDSYTWSASGSAKSIKGNFLRFLALLLKFHVKLLQNIRPKINFYLFKYHISTVKEFTFMFNHVRTIKFADDVEIRMFFLRMSFLKVILQSGSSFFNVLANHLQFSRLKGTKFLKNW